MIKSCLRLQDVLYTVLSVCMSIETGCSQSRVVPSTGRRNGSDSSSLFLYFVPDNSSESQTDNVENVLNRASLRIKVGGL